MPAWVESTKQVLIYLPPVGKIIVQSKDANWLLLAIALFGRLTIILPWFGIGRWDALIPNVYVEISPTFSDDLVIDL